MFLLSGYMLIVFPYTCVTSFASAHSVAEWTNEKVLSYVFFMFA